MGIFRRNIYEKINKSLRNTFETRPKDANIFVNMLKEARKINGIDSFVLEISKKSLTDDEVRVIERYSTVSTIYDEETRGQMCLVQVDQIRKTIGERNYNELLDKKIKELEQEILERNDILMEEFRTKSFAFQTQKFYTDVESHTTYKITDYNKKGRRRIFRKA